MTNLILPRRQFLAGLISTMAAPAIIRVDSLMKLPQPIAVVPVRSFELQKFVEVPFPESLKLSISSFKGLIQVGDFLSIPTWGEGRIVSVVHRLKEI